MTILGIVGAIGSGKSHTQLKLALDYCERKERQLVCNFNVDVSAILRYAKHKKFKWVEYLCKRGGICQIHNPESLQALFIPESVICLDEAQIFLNSRSFMSTSKSLIADLSQSRKDGCDLVYAAQVDNHVDKQFRELTQFWCHCMGLSIHDKKSKRSKLHWKKIYYFDASNYQEWLEDKRARSSHWRTKFAYAFQYEGGFLSEADRILFDCFDSYSRLDGGSKFMNLSSFNGTSQNGILEKCDRLTTQEIKISTLYQVPLLQVRSIRDYQFSYPLSPLPQPPQEPSSPAKGVLPIIPLPAQIPKLTKSNLVRRCLDLSRSKKLQGLPRFNDLTYQQLENWLKTH